MRSYEGYLEGRYVEIVRVLVEAIREADPDRPTASASTQLRRWH
jgi:hypothetical protein